MFGRTTFNYFENNLKNNNMFLLQFMKYKDSPQWLVLEMADLEKTRSVRGVFSKANPSLVRVIFEIQNRPVSLCV